MPTTAFGGDHLHGRDHIDDEPGAKDFMRFHNPGVVNTIDELTANIPSGPPGYQYQEPNYRKPIREGT